MYTKIKFSWTDNGKNYSFWNLSLILILNLKSLVNTGPDFQPCLSHLSYPQSTSSDWYYNGMARVHRSKLQCTIIYYEHNYWYPDLVHWGFPVVIVHNEF